MEDTNNKNNKRRRKKKKSLGRKIWGVIWRLLVLAIIIAVGYYTYKYFHITATMGDDVEYDPLSATALGIDPEKLKTVGRLNLLLIGESDANQGTEDVPYYLADTIMVVSYNPQTQQASILSIPRDTYVGRDKANASASYKINCIYRNKTEMDSLVEAVNDLTGLEIDKYLVVDTKAIVEVVDAIGGVTFDVPIDMDYEDGNQELFIHLKAGEQLLDGNKAEQLLRFRHNQDGTSYPSEYGDNDIGRMRTQREFMEVAAKQLLRIENAPKIIDIMNIIFRNIETNLDMETLKYYIPYAFKFNTQNILSDALPGSPEYTNDVWIFAADKEATEVVVDDLFTDKVITEEIEEELVDTNTIVEGETVAEKEEKITIELLNGTDNKEEFTKIKEKLKEEGYFVKKTGTTKATTTKIINRTDNSSSISRKIKEVVGMGEITEGSDNAKVDYTIIIGEDYE